MATSKAEKKLFLELLEVNLCNVSKTCKKFDINRDKYYKWQKDEWFKTATQNINDKLIDDSESELYKKVKAGNLGAIIFHLKTKGRDRGWDEKQTIRIEEDENKKLDLSKLSSRELKTYLDIMQKITFEK